MNKVFIYITMLFFLTLTSIIFSMEKEEKGKYKRVKSFPVLVCADKRKVDFQKKKYSQSEKNFFNVKEDGELANPTHQIKYSGAHICSVLTCLKKCPLLVPIKASKNPNNEIEKMKRIMELKKRFHDRRKKTFETI